MPKKKGQEDRKKIVKKFCPICGSAAIIPLKDGKFICPNCKAVFSKPKETKIEMGEKPRYIG